MSVYFVLRVSDKDDKPLTRVTSHNICSSTHCSKRVGGRIPRCGGLSLSLISSVFHIHVTVGWMGWCVSEIKIWTDGACQWCLQC